MVRQPEVPLGAPTGGFPLSAAATGLGSGPQTFRGAVEAAEDAVLDNDAGLEMVHWPVEEERTDDLE